MFFIFKNRKWLRQFKFEKIWANLGRVHLKFGQRRLYFVVLAIIDSETNYIHIFLEPLNISNIFIPWKLILHVVELDIGIKLQQKAENKQKLITVPERQVRDSVRITLISISIEFINQFLIDSIH